MTVHITSLNRISEHFRLVSRTASEALVSPQDDATAVIKLFAPAKGSKWYVAGTHDIFDIDLSSHGRSTDHIVDRRQVHDLVLKNGIDGATVKLQDMKPAFVPIYADEDLEDPDEDFNLENLLGEPVFFEGDAWPRDASGRSFSFYAQFWDPDRFYGEFIQIFIADIETGGDVPDVHIRHLTQTDFDTKRAMRIPTPADVPNGYIRERFLASRGEGPMQIIGWEIRDTFYSVPVRDLMEGLGFRFALPTKQRRVGNRMIAEREPISTEGESEIMFQLGGVPASTQGNDFSQDNVYFNNIYNGQWGDGGVLHYTADGQGTGDMM